MASMKEEYPDPRIAELAEKWLNGTITPEEQQEYADWYNQQPEASLDIPSSIAANKEEHAERILAKINEARHVPRLVPFRRRLVRIAAAAAILVLMISTGYYFFFREPEQKTIGSTPPPALAHDVAPGSNKAILTTDNHSAIILDDAANGIIMSEGNASVQKTADGQLTYTAIDKQEKVVYHTVSTPRGGQYKITLPDGTQAWLNAASSIQFPTAFTGNRRDVTITGEVYLEVSKDASKPFVVEVNHSEIEVLGTHFNVMAYDNEESLQTTLLEGSVRFSHEGKSVLLKPGQQAVLAHRNAAITMRNGVDPGLITAWKNGLTAFKSADIKTIMRQVERWYDVDVSYQGNIPQRSFTGEIPRDVNLSELLKLLRASKIEFIIDGTNKKLTIKS